MCPLHAADAVTCRLRLDTGQLTTALLLLLLLLSQYMHTQVVISV